MSQTSRPMQVAPNSAILPLKYPQSVAVFDTYEDAQKAVDYLADERFPVQNLAIVGTDLKLVERVLGRRGWPQVVASGALSGVGTGLIVGLFMVLLYPNLTLGVALLGGLIIGIAMGLLSAAMAHASTRGQRDFSSVTATVATRYEVLGEHNVVQRAREMLAAMPGARAAAFGGSGFSGTITGGPGGTPPSGPGQQGYPPQSYQGQSYQQPYPQQPYPSQPYPPQAYQQQPYPEQPYQQAGSEPYQVGQSYPPPGGPQQPAAPDQTAAPGGSASGRGHDEPGASGR